MAQKKLLKVAIVADWLTVFGGAESVIQSFTNIFPQAPIFTTVYIPEKMTRLGKHMQIHTSFLQKLPKKIRANHPFLLPFLPKAIETLNVSEFDIVLSSSSFVGKGVLTNPQQLHICYCHSPTRYFWGDWQNYLHNFPLPKWIKWFLPRRFTKYRQWDFFASKRPDIMIGNSHFIQKSIRKYYKRESEIIPPPVDVERFQNGIQEKKGDFYLYFGRLVPQKKVDILMAAFATMPKKKLIIAGTGRDAETLKKMAKKYDNILFLGFIKDDEVPQLLGSARALLFPQLEDAGITALEALAAGTPIIAYGKGGVRTTLCTERERETGDFSKLTTGVFFEEQTPESVQKGIKTFEKREKEFHRKKLQKHAAAFSRDIFEKKIQTFIEEKYSSYKK